MILGILSDTHGHLDRTQTAIRQLKDAGAETLIHCGDLGSEDIVSLLFEVREEGLPVLAVPGNVDEWDPGLILYAKKLGLSLPRTAKTTLGGLRIAVHHGHHAHEMSTLERMPGLDLLFTGHTHVAKDETVGSLRVLNPGAVYRAQIPSVAVFHTDSRDMIWIPLEV